MTGQSVRRSGCDAIPERGIKKTILENVQVEKNIEVISVIDLVRFINVDQKAKESPHVPQKSRAIVVRV